MTSAPITEQVRRLAEVGAGPDDELDFYAAALDLGCSESEADRIDELLTERVMRARGGI